MDFDFGTEGSTDSFFSRLQSDSSSRNLSQIFEDDLLPLRKESRNLRYQPGTNRPTPVSKDSSLPSSTSSSMVSSSSAAAQRQSSPWVVVFARVIVIYEGDHPLGRMGLALSMLGQNEAVNMIMYQHKNKTISNTKLKPNGFKLHLRDSYLQFYDDNRKYWSVHFVKKTDEMDFIEIMVKNELPFEHHTSRSEGDGSVEQQQQARQRREQVEQPADHMEHRRPHAEHDEQQQDPRPVAPQPMPRLRSLATAAEAGPTYLLQHLDSNHSSLPPSDNPNAISEEDVIVTPMARPIGTTTSSEDDDSGSPLVLSSSETEMSSVSVFPMKAEGILRAMRQLANGRGLSADDSTTMPNMRTSDDAEDRLLAMEQALLDMKKENRALVKLLRQREQELIEVQTSSVAVLEKLLTNQNLSEKNSLLVDSMKEERRSRLAGEQSPSSTSVAPSSSCTNCERAGEEISFLKRHISALKVALREPGSDI